MHQLAEISTGNIGHSQFIRYLFKTPSEEASLWQDVHLHKAQAEESL